MRLADLGMRLADKLEIDQVSHIPASFSEDRIVLLSALAGCLPVLPGRDCIPVCNKCITLTSYQIIAERISARL